MAKETEAGKEKSYKNIYFWAGNNSRAFWDQSWASAIEPALSPGFLSEYSKRQDILANLLALLDKNNSFFLSPDKTFFF